GCGVALVTPFDENGQINYDQLATLIDWHIKHKTDALIIAGTTGEASTIKGEEHKELIRKSVEIAYGRIPIIAGTGSNETAWAIELSKAAENAGADGLLLVTPYYNKTNTKGLIKHYETIADVVNIPMILYNVPSRTGLNIPLEAMVYLSKNPKIVGVKDASGNLTYSSEIMRLCDKDFVMLSGNDDIIVPMMAIGATGVISVVGNILPEETHNITACFLAGKVEEARALQLKYNGFIHSLFYETNPIPVKTAMNLLGMNVGDLRLPLYEMDAGQKERMIDEMKKIGLIEK
ncbi:MAG: 4-hydroxy-tetrahydrodipicolinate synthase, partial [Bacteroidota bacterium]